MSDTRLSGLTAINSASDSDILYIIDVSDTGDGASGSSRGITKTNLLGVTSTEMGYLSGVTSAIQTQIDTKQATITGAATTIDTEDLTASRALVSNVSGKVAVSAVTSTELGYLDGVTSAIQTQIDAKSPIASPEFTGDVGLATGANITVNETDPYMIITLPAISWTPTTTSGCASIVTVEAGSNDIDYKVLDFDTSSDENAFINFTMPENWDAGVITFRYIWTNASGLTTESVVFELSGRSYANDDAIDQAVGDTVEVEDTWIAQGDIHISAWSGDVTLAGTPAAGEWIHLEITRDVSQDDLTGDARLIGVQIKYKTKQYSN